MSPETTAEDFARAEFETATERLVDEIRAGMFGSVVLVWSLTPEGRSVPTHLRFPGEAEPIPLEHAYRSERLRRP